LIQGRGEEQSKNLSSKTAKMVANILSSAKMQICFDSSK
jgi:hypothetical protein